MLKTKTATTIGNTIAFATLIAFPISAENFIAPPMVNIPAGTFIMGNQNGDPATMPIHSVEVDAFQMGKYAVTIAEFKLFAKATNYQREATCNDFIDGEGLRGPTHLGTGRWDKHRYYYSDYQPVTCVNLTDAKAYAKWLSQKTGIKYRIPTEQEWEYATKANTSSRYFWGDDPNLTKACLYGNFADYTGESVNNQKFGLSNVGWIGHVNCDDGEAYDAIVGLYRPNPFGLYDMVGNAAQLVDSCYNENGYDLKANKKEDTSRCEYTVHRGGTWHYPAQPHYIRDRYKSEGWNVFASQGFRLAADGQSDKTHQSTQAFEATLKREQTQHLANREKLLLAPEKVMLTPTSNGQFTLHWQPSQDPRVVSYDIYQSNSRFAHLYSGFYQNHYSKIQTLTSDHNHVNVELPQQGGSFRVVANTQNQSSLPSEKAIHFIAPITVSLPGKISMQNAAQLNNVALYHFEARDDKPESYIIFKTNKNSDKSAVSATFNVHVKKSGWYQFNYRGRSSLPGEFFKLWQGNRLVGKFDYDPEIDDKVSTRFKVYLEAGKHPLQLSVHREKYDRWGVAWLEFSEIAS